MGGLNDGILSALSGASMTVFFSGSDLHDAAKIIREGGLVAFPTETVYGLGANAYDEAAVQKIFLAKGRPATDPLIVHIHTLEQLEDLAVNIPPLAYELAEHFWAGPLTLVLQKSAQVAESVTSGLNTVAVRMPFHPTALELIRLAGVPICAPSANLFTRPSPTSAQHVYHDLAGKIDAIIDGGRSVIGIESTILNLTTSPPQILRVGGITVEQLQTKIPSVLYIPRYERDESQPLVASGSFLKHYSPHAEVRVFLGEAEAVYQRILSELGAGVGVIALADQVSRFEQAFTVSLGDSLTTAAQRLFDALRLCDAAGMEKILVWGIPEGDLGTAIYDRLYRAAEGHIIHLP